MTELEQYGYMDLQTDISSAIEQYGARKILMDFRHNYPNHFNELAAQVMRLYNPKQIPVLLLKKE